MRHRTYCAIVFGIGAFAPGAAFAQLAEAAKAIDARDLLRHVGVIADDSMLGRDTPSPGLEMTARYVANQFEKLGLKPGGDNGTWFQRYPTRAPVSIRLEFRAGGRSAMGGEAYLQSPLMPSWLVRDSVVLVAGRHTRQSLSEDGLRGRIVLYIPPANVSFTDRWQVIDQLVTAQEAQGVIVVEHEPISGSQVRPTMLLPRLDRHEPWAVRMRPTLLVQMVFDAAGVDPVRLRMETSPLIRDLPLLEVEVSPSVHWKKGMNADTAMAMNVVGMLEGTETTAKPEYVLFTAHMDHLGIISDHSDSIRNGAGDNAVGVAGLIELAQAFLQTDPRPRRSLIFLATSGGRKGFTGLNFLTERMLSIQNALDFLGGERPPELLERLWTMTANINIDMIGYESGDSVNIAGFPDLEFAVSPEWIIQGHPELDLTVVDAGTALLPASEHYVLARRLMVPSLYFHNGTHSLSRDDSSAEIDADQAARILRLAFYIGYEIANAAKPPQWSPAGHTRLMRIMAAE